MKIWLIILMGQKASLNVEMLQMILAINDICGGTFLYLCNHCCIFYVQGCGMLFSMYDKYVAVCCSQGYRHSLGYHWKSYFILWQLIIFRASILKKNWQLMSPSYTLNYIQNIFSQLSTQWQQVSRHSHYLNCCIINGILTALTHITMNQFSIYAIQLLK